MKLRTVNTAILVLTLFYSCTPSTNYFIGKWQIISVVDENGSFDLAENWMHLQSNGTFESYDGDAQKTEQGTWDYQSEEKLLFIDGEGNEGDSQWHLLRRNDTLFFHSTSDNLYLISTKK